MNSLNVFSSDDFLKPENFLTPLVELTDSFNPFREKRVRIFAKMLSMTSVMNGKILAATNMLEEARSSGLLKRKKVKTLVENSSGNMILSFATIAQNYGIENVVGVIPRDLAPGKFEAIRLAGVDIISASKKPGALSGIALAKKLGRQPGSWCPRQYESNANSSAYQKWLGPQIWQQTGGKITVFCAGVGTGGTVTGTSRYLRKMSNNITIVGITSLEDDIPGVRNLERLKEIKINWCAAIDYHIEVATYDSFLTSQKFVKKGYFVGPSSGLAFYGTSQFINEQIDRKTLDDLRNENGEVVVVFVCMDTQLPYAEKYSTHLHPEDLEYQI